MTKQTIYTVGGTVQAGGGLYISRQADDDLLQLCRDGAFAYVLTSRQIGKSSLMVRTAEQLAVEGTRSVIIDLTQLGVQVSAEAWYLGLLTAITDELVLDVEVVKWWRERSDFGTTQRLTQFFQEVVLAETTEPIVIFVDEIDSTLSLPFTDDFFAAIRFMYNVRARSAEFQRLTFVLIGVATPSDLISDPHRTPFNIGQQVTLTDFTLEEARPLIEGLELPRDHATEVLGWVMKWTGGHPYLTQRLCRTIAEEFRSSWTEDEVEQAVNRTFFGRMSEEDNNLQFVRDMLTKRAPDKLRVLDAYKEVRLGRRPVRDEDQSPIKAHLKLSGIVKRLENKLHVRNPIYHEVFDRSWINEHWPLSWFQTIPTGVKIASATVIAFLVTAVVSLGLLLRTQAQLGESQQQRKSEADRAAERYRLIADSLRIVLDESNRLRELAEEETNRAESNAEQALRALEQVDRQKALALRRSIVADSLKGEAERASRLAQAREKEVERQRRVDLARFLADQAEQQVQLNQNDRAALLARQAFLFNQRNDGPWTNEIYTALLKALPDAGGPIVLRGHSAAVRAVAFDTQRGLLASAGDDGDILLWQPEQNHAPLLTLSGHTKSVRALAFSPKELVLASASEDHTSRIWMVSESQYTALPFENHQDRIWTVAFAPNGRTLAIGGAGGSALVWDAKRPETASSIILSQENWVSAVAISSDGSWLATGGSDGVLRLWQIETREPQLRAEKKLESEIRSLAFAPQSLDLAAGGANGVLWYWRFEPGAATLTIRKQFLAHEARINGLDFSPRGNLLATASSDNRAKIWDMASAANTPVVILDHTKFVLSVAFAPDGERLATGCADKNVRLWYTNAEALAEMVCKVAKRNLSAGEWQQFIQDIEYEATCPELPPGEGVSNGVSPSGN